MSVELSIVVPLYNEEGNVEQLVREISQSLETLGAEYEVILVDDGSHDRTWQKIQAAAARNSNFKGIALSRNFGHQNALFAGLHYCSGRTIVTMDGDLQHPPEKIVEMYRLWQKGFKIIQTTRIDRHQTRFLKRLTSKFFYRVFSRLSGFPVSEGSSDFRLIDREVAQTIMETRDSELILREMSYWVGYPSATIEYEVRARHAGTTKFNRRQMMRFAANSLVSFSNIPLKLGIRIRLITACFAFLELLYIIVRFVRSETVPGWASILGVISFMFGVLFVLLGIIGIYLGSILAILRNRPRFLVNSTTGIENER